MGETDAEVQLLLEIVRNFETQKLEKELIGRV